MITTFIKPRKLTWRYIWKITQTLKFSLIQTQTLNSNQTSIALKIPDLEKPSLYHKVGKAKFWGSWVLHWVRVSGVRDWQRGYEYFFVKYVFLVKLLVVDYGFLVGDDLCLLFFRFLLNKKLWVFRLKGWIFLVFLSW